MLFVGSGDAFHCCFASYHVILHVVDARWKNGRELELALTSIVYTHTKIAYDNLWTKFETTDKVPTEMLTNPSWTDQVYDMYADLNKFAKYYSAHNGETTFQLHSQTGGINREHALPNSWWGGESGNSIAYTDLHHLTPADGAANSGKSDYPLGEYSSGMTMGWPTETKTSTMGNNENYTYVEADNTADHSGSLSHTWIITANANGYGGGAARVWEPCDEYKGDFARMYFYVICAYEGQLTWQTNYMFTNTSDGNNYTNIKAWALELLLKWHRQDPVSQKELDRNDAVYGIQGNRNPFIDYPDFVEYIWGDMTTETFVLDNAWCAYDPQPDPDPDPDPDPEPVVEKADPMLYFPHIAYVGEPFSAPMLNTDSEGAVRYFSSNPAVAAVDAATGEVTIVAPGTAVITVVQAATDKYAKGIARYMIKVLE